MTTTYPEPYVSQLDLSGSGRNDCLQASEAAVLLAFGKVPASTDHTALLNMVSLATRGTPDTPNNTETNLYQASNGLIHWGLPVDLDTNWSRCIAASWCIMLVDGTAVSLADGSKPYPASWFNYAVGPDHFIVSGPSFDGTFNWIMNPLDPDKVWKKYALDSVQRAFNCGYILPAAPSAAPHVVPKWRANRKFALKPTTDHESAGLVTVPNKGTGIDWGARKTVDGEVWARLQFRAVTGYAPVAYITEPAS